MTRSPKDKSLHCAIPGERRQNGWLLAETRDKMRALNKKAARHLCPRQDLLFGVAIVASTVRLPPKVAVLVFDSLGAFRREQNQSVGSWRARKDETANWSRVRQPA
jgi:hypothetical protein